MIDGSIKIATRSMALTLMVTALLLLRLVADCDDRIRLSFPAQSTSMVTALTKTVVVLMALTLMATALLLPQWGTRLR